jgi:hypothetical protein
MGGLELSRSTGNATGTEPSRLPESGLEVLVSVFAGVSADWVPKSHGVAMTTAAVSTSASRNRLSIASRLDHGAELRNRIVATSVKGMAARDTTNRQPTTSECTVSFQCLDRVGRASWKVATGRWEERRECKLVEPNPSNEDSLGNHGDIS